MHKKEWKIYIKNLITVTSDHEVIKLILMILISIFNQWLFKYFVNGTEHIPCLRHIICNPFSCLF